MNNSSLPVPSQSNDQRVTSFFDKYFTQTLEFASNDVDAVVGFLQSVDLMKPQLLAQDLFFCNKLK